MSPDEPRRETGVYWGYTVRIAHTISEIFTKCPYAGGYDLTIGTSDRGANVQEVPTKSLKFNHSLLVFGGLQGLEAALSNDEKLQVDDPELLFDQYLNVLPRQGSRTIRTEEAILIAMAAIQEKLMPDNNDIEEELIKDALPRSEDTGGIIPRPGETKLAKKRKRLEEKQAETEQQFKSRKPVVDIPETSEPIVKKEKPQTLEPIVKKEKPQTLEPIVKKEKKSKKNPFKKQEDTSNSQLEVATDSNEVDFEVVPIGKSENEKKNKASQEDLSRFD